MIEERPPCRLDRAEEFEPEEIDQMVRLYEGGISLTNIARAFRCSETAVRRRLVERGVKIRDPYWRSREGSWYVTQPEDYSGRDDTPDPAVQFARDRSAMYPDPKVRRLMFERFLAWYRAQERGR